MSDTGKGLGRGTWSICRMGRSFKIAEVEGVIQPEMPMIPYPLHPAIVHFPLVLAVLLPFVAAAVLFVSRRPGAGRGAWVGLTVMAFLLPVSASVALETGQQQEDRVERVVSERYIGEHEEAGEGLLIGSIIVSAVILLGLARGRVGRVARYMAVPGGLVALALAVRVGASGGALVYEHGAASAYVGPADSGPSVGAPEPLRREPGNDHDRDDDDRH